MNGPAEDAVELQLGFGLGRDFLQRWQACRDAVPSGRRLHYVVIDEQPPSRATLREAWACSPLAELAEALIDQWPPLTPDLHRLGFDAGRVQLLLAVGPARHWLRQLELQAHRLRLEVVDTQADPAGGLLRLGRALARLSAPGALLTSPLVSTAMRHALSSAGFEIDAGAEPPSTLSARYAPRFTPTGPRRVRRRGVELPHRALIVGAGLAGCASAWALAEAGWHSRLIDRHEAPAREASAVAAGLFHGSVHAQDGAHARLNRAAALEAHRAVRWAIERHAVKGQTDGLLRLDTTGRSADELRAMLAVSALPADYVQALDAAAAARRCGLPVQHPAWFFAGGGWVHPAGLAASWLRRAGTMSEFAGSRPVQRIRQTQGLWQLLDAQGRLIDSSATLILANAIDALRLLGMSDAPVVAVRGQLSVLDQADDAPPAQRLAPRLPVSGDGYVLPAIDGTLLFGATAQPGDDDARVRAEDHLHNLQRLRRLVPGSVPELQPDRLQGRVGWRCVSSDRLPLIGTAPGPLTAPAQRLSQVPRQSGLYVFTALGSRGVGWAALGAQVLAAMIAGSPVPLGTPLVDAIDPARFALRRARRAAPQVV